MGVEDEEAVGAVGIFPGDGVEVGVGGDEQDAFGCRGKGAVGGSFWWEESGVEIGRASCRERV